MPRTMTMNGHQTQTTVPLDLRTTKRECGNGAEGTPTSKGRSVLVRVPYPIAPLTEDGCPNGNPSHTVEPLAHRCGSSLIRPPVNTGNPAVLEKKHSPAVTSHTPFTPNPGERSTTDTRTQDISSSRLPFRKRQFPTEWETPEQSRTPPGREERLSPYKNKDLCCRPSPPKIVLKSYDDESIGSLASVSHRQLSVASGFDNGHQSVDPVRSMQALRPYYPYPGYPFYSWPSRSPLVVNVPVSHLQSSLYPTGHTEHLLADVAQATCQDDDGDTALHIAVVQGQEAQIQRMILLLGLVHTDLDIYNNLRQTPLHLAVITHQAQLVGALLHAGADPGALDRNGQTAVHLCCEHGQQACLSVVLSHPSILTCLEVRNYEGLTPLHLAVQGGHKELVRMLLDAGADINAMQDIKSGHSPLIHAVENHNMGMVHFLIENDCNVNVQSYSGNTALHSACGRGQVDTARLLLKNRADSSVKNYHNDTPAMVAKNKKVIDVLRGKGSRNQQPKAQQCVPASPHRSTPHSQNRGSPSPSLGLSPLATPTASPLHRSASHSPRAPPTPSPHSQSAESLSGRQSPMKTQESEQLPVRLGSDRMTAVDISLAQRRTYSLTHSYPPAMHQSPITDAQIGHLLTYYSPGVQRPLYPEPPFILLHTNIPYPATVSTASQMTPGQSRPSSHCSDQSDVSITSKGNS
ncbi:B-cell lymphoma 3 protein homolog isoform X1 [Salmo salar]|uniref:B-cell lymphoma 3 protein homolog isoform X1 n=1 Tax=Salmo salar TaxID=8030 RepID=A0A1S3RYQ2_SALSA|nr:B-cell lymphoma 3 protein homolog isoform X1 [Salmo salar]|eukprot:XP_014057067.1 PREDICTED: B-cell lymphoma 3 protein homolog isoform X1 [Salmo salar]